MALQVVLPVILSLLAQGAAQYFVRKRTRRIAAEGDRRATAEFMNQIPEMMRKIQMGLQAGTMGMQAGAQPTGKTARPQPQQPQKLPEVPPITLPEPSFAQPTQQLKLLEGPPRFRQDIQPENIIYREEPVSLEQPKRFQKPMQVSSMSVNPKTRNVTFSMKPDQAAMDAQFGTAFKDLLDKARAGGTAGLSEAEMRENLAFNLAGEFGFFASDQWMAQNVPTWKDVQEPTYFRLAEALRRKDDFRAEMREKAEKLGLSEDVMERWIKFNAYIETSRTMNEYMPDDIREGFAAMQLPSLKPETEEVLAERGVSPMLAGGEQIGAAREQLRTEEVQQAAAIKGAQIGTEFAMRAIEPITGKDAAKHGIGVGFPTYMDLANAGKRFATDVERKDYLDLTDVTNMIDSVDKLVKNVFSSSDSYPARVAHGVKIRASMASGGDLGLDAKEYDRQLGVMGRKMLSLVERGGRFTNQDMEQILKTLPKLNLLAPDGRELAGRLIERARIIASKKLESYRDIAIKPIGQPGTIEPLPTPKAEATPQTGDPIVDEKGNITRVK